MDKKTKKIIGCVAVGVGIVGVGVGAYALGKKAGLKIPKSFYGTRKGTAVPFYNSVGRSFPDMCRRQESLLTVTFDHLKRNPDIPIKDLQICDTRGNPEPFIDFMATALNAIGITPNTLLTSGN